MTDAIVTVNGVRLEVRALGRPAKEALTILLLHEGLGSVSQWQSFPEELSRRLPQCAVVVYSRQGYGQSDPIDLPRPLDYKEQEALHALPALLDELGCNDVILLGHSDGASISAYFAGEVSDPRLRGMVLMAPFFLNEEACVTAIERTLVAYESGELRERLKRYHGTNVDCAFHGWCDAWLAPGFRNWSIEQVLAKISVPVLIMRGTDDDYGSVLQVEVAQAKMRAPLEVILLEGCGHAPYREREEDSVAAVADFVTRLLNGSEAR